MRGPEEEEEVGVVPRLEFRKVPLPPSDGGKFSRLHHRQQKQQQHRRIVDGQSSWTSRGPADEGNELLVQSARGSSTGVSSKKLVTQSARSSSSASSKPRWNGSVKVPDKGPAVRIHLDPGLAFHFRNLERIPQQLKQDKKVGDEQSVEDAKIVRPETPPTPKPVQHHSKSIRVLKECWDGWIVSCSDDGLVALSQINDNKNNKCVRIFKGHAGPVLCVETFGPKCLVTGSQDKTVRMWNTMEPESCRMMKGHRDSVTKVDTIYSEREIVSASSDNSIRIWDGDSYNCKRVLEMERIGINHLQVLEPWGNAILATSPRGIVSLWDSKGNQLAKISEETKIFHAIHIPSSHKFVFVGCKSGEIFSVKFSKKADERLKSSQPFQVSNTRSAVNVLNSHGKILLAGFSNGYIEAFNMTDQTSLRLVKGHRSWIMDIQIQAKPKYLPDNQPMELAKTDAWVASCSFDGKVRFTKSLHKFLTEGEEAPQVTERVHDSTVYRIALTFSSKTGVQLFSAGADSQLHKFKNI